MWSFLLLVQQLLVGCRILRFRLRLPLLLLHLPFVFLALIMMILLTAPLKSVNAFVVVGPVTITTGTTSWWSASSAVTITTCQTVQQQQQRQQHAVQPVQLVQQWRTIPRRHQHAPALPSSLSPAAAATSLPHLDHLDHPARFRGLYPPATQIRSGTLEVDSVNTLYYEIHSSVNDPTSKDPNTASSSSTPPPPPTQPRLCALVLHGGPGAGCHPRHATFFDTSLYTVVLLDQRGSGRSTPRGHQLLDQPQTLNDLVQDCERLRRHWMMQNNEDGELMEHHQGADGTAPPPWDVVLGGSWGCTLALAYVAQHPYAVKSVILRGICLMRPVEIDWLFAAHTNNIRNHRAVGARHYFPQAWREFAAAVGCRDDDDNNNNTSSADPRAVLHAYYDRLLGDDPVIRWEACRSWMKWEMTVFASSSTMNSTQAELEDSKAWSTPPVAVWDAASGQWSVCDGSSNQVLDEDSLCQMGFSSSSPATIESTVQDLRVGLHLLSSHDTGTITPSTAAATTTARPVSAIRTAATAPTLQNPDPNPNSNSTANTTSAINNATAAAEHPGHNYIPAQQMLTCYYSVNDHYAVNHIDLMSTAMVQLVRHQIPCIAVHGGLDRVCPPDTALDLLRQFQQVQQQFRSVCGSNSATVTSTEEALFELRIPMKSGHSMYDPAITNELVQATERMAERLRAKTMSRPA